MIRIIVIIALLFEASALKAQDVFTKIISEYCDSIKDPANSYLKTDPSIEVEFYKRLLDRHKNAVSGEVNSLVLQNRERRSDAAIRVYEYTEHLLLQDCPDYLNIHKARSTILITDSSLRELYFTARKFVILLEKGVSNDSLLRYLYLPEASDRAKMNTLLTKIKQDIKPYQRASTFTTIHLKEDGHLFRCRFYDYKTNALNYRIDILFRDKGDLKIDVLEFFNKEASTPGPDKQPK